MNVELDKATLKAIARRQHAALMERGVAIKLSDVLESLANGFEHRNLAHLYGTFKEEAAREANLRTIESWARWVMYEFYDDNPLSPTYQATLWGILPEGTTLDRVASTDWQAVAALLELVRPFPEGFKLSADTVALETYVEASSIGDYGMPEAADEHRVGDWVREEFGFRVPESGVETSVYDRRDDGANSTFVLVALNERDAQYVRTRIFAAA